MESNFLNRGKQLIISRLWLVLFLCSLVISISFYIFKTQVVESLSIDISTQVGQLDELEMHDFGDYTEQVDNLLYTGSLIKDGKVLNRYPPLYSLLVYCSVRISKLSGLKLSLSLFLLAAFFIAISTAIIGEIANLLYQNKLLAFFAGLLYTTHPYILQGLTKTMSVTPFMSMLYLSLFVYYLLFTKEKHNLFYPILIGILLGLAMLIRPIGLFLPFVFSIFVFIHFKKLVIYKKLLISVIILGSSLITILPWQIVNFVHDQKILLSSDEVSSILDGVRFNNDRDKKHIDLPIDVDSLAIKLSTSGITTRSDFFKFVYSEFVNQPVTMIKLILIKAVRSWYGVFSQDSQKEKIKLIIFIIYFLLVFIGISKISFKDKRWLAFLTSNILLILYFWGLIILVVPLARYLYPIFGLVVIFIPAIFKKVNMN